MGVRLMSATALVLALLAVGQAGAQPTMPPLPEDLDLSKPLTLVDCVRVGLAVNPALAIANQQIRQAQAGVTQARAALMPNLGLNWDVAASKSLAGGSSLGGQRTDRDLVLSLSQTFYRSGLSQEIGAARAMAQAAGWGRQDTERTLVLGVAQNYYAALAAGGLADVARRAVLSARQHLDAADARISAGTAAPADRYPFLVELHQAMVQAITTENQVKTTLNGLKQAMGLPAEVSLQLAESLGRPPLPDNLDELRQSAYQARPDVLRQKSQVAAARLTAQVAQIERGPVLNATGTGSYGQHTDVTGEAWQLQLGVSLPVFDGGLTRANLEKSRASLDIAEQTLQQLELLISLEVEDSYLGAVEANARIEAVDAVVEAAQVSLEAAQEKYKAGVGTVLEVTDAEQSLRQAEADQVKARYDYNTSLAGLRSAVGQAIVPGAE